MELESFLHNAIINISGVTHFFMVGETFFTTIGCMDGRCQEIVDEFGRAHFGALYPDTITEAGLVGILANHPKDEFLVGLKSKILLSIQKHHSKGIVIDGHSECAGNPVDDVTHKKNVRNAVKIISAMIDNAVPVLGIYLSRHPQDQLQWQVAEVFPHN